MHAYIRRRHRRLRTILPPALRLNVSEYDRSFNDASPSLRINPSYAFVEFRSQRDAEDAYYDMCVYLLHVSKLVH
jgi:hypothetical protein